MGNIDEALNLEHQFNFYLNKVGLKKSELRKVHVTELKRAFFGGIGILLQLEANHLTLLSDVDAVLAMENLTNQTLKFWENEANKI